MLIHPCFQIASSYRKLCSYPHAIKLLHHIENCARTPAFARPAKPYKYHREPRGAIEYAFKMVLTNCCQNIDPSYRKLCSYPHVLYYWFSHLREHKFRHNFSNSSRFICGDGDETTEHFLSRCRHFANTHSTLLEQVSIV